MLKYIFIFNIGNFKYNVQYLGDSYLLFYGFSNENFILLNV